MSHTAEGHLSIFKSFAQIKWGDVVYYTYKLRCSYFDVGIWVCVHLSLNHKYIVMYAILSCFYGKSVKCFVPMTRKERQKVILHNDLIGRKYIVYTCTFDDVDGIFSFHFKFQTPCEVISPAGWNLTVKRKEKLFLFFLVPSLFFFCNFIIRQCHALWYYYMKHNKKRRGNSKKDERAKYLETLFSLLAYTRMQEVEACLFVRYDGNDDDDQGKYIIR